MVNALAHGLCALRRARGDADGDLGAALPPPEPHAASAAKAAGEKALRLNPSHSYPPFLLYSLMGQMGAGDGEESGAMVSRAIRNHCHHGGGASAALQKRCKDHIMQGNLNLFV